jgi:hypothetical protein
MAKQKVQKDKQWSTQHIVTFFSNTFLSDRRDY